MIEMMIGIAIWSLVHFIPSIGMPVKRTVIKAIGENAYKGVFSVLLIVSVVLMVIGWKDYAPHQLYLLPGFTNNIAHVLLAFAFVLFGSANFPTRIKRAIRHPQLLGVILWSIAHLMLNGDSRSLLLFSGLGLWAFLEIALINRRDGVWVKPRVNTWVYDVIGLAIGVALFCAAVFAHPYISGIALI